MENNNVMDNQRMNVDVKKQNEVLSNQNMTNDQKLEYLRKIIQDVESSIKSEDISKGLIKKQGE